MRMMPKTDTPNVTENVIIHFNIAEQKDRLFSGNLTIKLENETEIDEWFCRSHWLG